MSKAPSGRLKHPTKKVPAEAPFWCRQTRSEKMVVSQSDGFTDFTFQDSRNNKLMQVSLSPVQVRKIRKDIDAGGALNTVARDTVDRKRRYISITRGDEKGELVVMAVMKMNKGHSDYTVGVALGPIAVKRLVGKLSAPAV